jgi:hypothetical protein
VKLTAAVLRKFADKGMTLEDVIDLAETWEEGEARDVPSLSKGALRTRKWRENQAAREAGSSRGDVTETRHGDVSHVGAGTQVVIPSLPSLRSEELVVGGGVVGRERASQADDWPEGRASDHAEQLVAAVASPWLDPNKSPDLVTTRGRVAAWKRDGASWEHDVLPVVTGLCANRRARISSWKFFDAAISRSIADNRAALQIPEARVIPLRPGGESFADRNAADIAEARRRLLEG